MGENLIIGFVTMVVCLTIQCIVVGALLDVLIFLEKRGLIRQTLIGITLLLVPLIIIMLAGNIIQITIWAALFFGYGEFKEFATAFYHSVVNFATLGYGDIVMSEKRRLLGALEAANGVLMFALTTGFLYTILSGVMERYWNEQIGQKKEKLK
jgi:hypothetical protein